MMKLEVDAKKLKLISKEEFIKGLEDNSRNLREMLKEIPSDDIETAAFLLESLKGAEILKLRAEVEGERLLYFMYENTFGVTYASPAHQNKFDRERAVSKEEWLKEAGNWERWHLSRLSVYIDNIERGYKMVESIELAKQTMDDIFKLKEGVSSDERCGYFINELGYPIFRKALGYVK